MCTETADNVLLPSVPVVRVNRREAKMHGGRPHGVFDETAGICKAVNSVVAYAPTECIRHADLKKSKIGRCISTQNKVTLVKKYVHTSTCQHSLSSNQHWFERRLRKKQARLSSTNVRIRYNPRVVEQSHEIKLKHKTFPRTQKAKNCKNNLAPVAEGSVAV